MDSSRLTPALVSSPTEIQTEQERRVSYTQSLQEVLIEEGLEEEEKNERKTIIKKHISPSTKARQLTKKTFNWTFEFNEEMCDHRPKREKTNGG